MLSMVIPVFNAASTLSMLVDRIQDVVSDMGCTCEIILVDDGSSDESWKLIEGLAARYGEIRGIRLARNSGQHNALLCGLRAARFPIVATMDDDLQNPPEELPKMLAALDADVDVVYGYPEAQRHGLLRDLASRLTKAALAVTMGASSARHVSAFRVFRRELQSGFAHYEGQAVNLDVLLSWATDRFKAVKVAHEPRRHGRSGYGVGQLVMHALNMVTGFSTGPLKLASLLGFGCALFGLLILAYVLGKWLLVGSAVPGFAFLASIISIFAGAQLLALGMMGEYIARIHLLSTRRPAYVVRERCGQGDEAASVATAQPAGAQGEAPKPAGSEAGGN